MERFLSTVDDVIGAFGGPAATHAVIGNPYPRLRDQQTYQWRKAGKFPAKWHKVMVEALDRAGYSADPALWHQRETSSDVSLTSGQHI